MTDARTSQSPTRLRHLFSILLTTCSVSNPLGLWDKFKTDLSEDILLQTKTENQTLLIEFYDEIYSQYLMLLEDLCVSMSGRSLDQYGLPTPQRNGNILQNSEILREQNYDTNELRTYVSENLPRLVEDQRAAYNHILELVTSKKVESYSLMLQEVQVKHL